MGIVNFCGKNIGTKAAGKMLMKLTTGIYFENIFQTAFLQKCLEPLFYTSSLCLHLYWRDWQKATHKMEVDYKCAKIENICTYK